MARRVPAALHSELSEYASLVRSLSTSQALDLSSHLSQIGASSSRNSEYEDEEEIDQLDPTDDDGEGQNQDVEQSSSGPAKLKGVKRASSAEERKELRAAQRKTRWPLRPDKVPRPEFELRDEVQSIVERHRRKQRLSLSIASQPGPSTQTLDANEGDSPSGSDSDAEGDDVTLPVLTSLTAAHLRTLLDSCAAHVPKAPPAMYKRLSPMNWKGVLAAASASDAVPPDVLERVEKRLRAIYGSNEGPGVPDEGEPLPVLQV